MKRFYVFIAVLLCVAFLFTACADTSSSTKLTTKGTPSKVVIHSPDPTEAPTEPPAETLQPTVEPTLMPTIAPTEAPTPTPEPTLEPTPEPTVKMPEPQSVTVYITKTGEKYHRDGCQYLKKSRIPIDLIDAIRKGYTPCSKCDPPQ